MNSTAVADSQALQLYNRIVGADDSFAFLKSMADSGTAETEWLDFKDGSNLTAPKLPKPDEAREKVKEIWSEALSGFANTQGGVLIWGIKAETDPKTKIDAARNLSLVHNTAEFKSRMHTLHGDATDPPVLGIKVESYDDPDQPNVGIVVCYVPESSNRPHRAEFSGKRFYIRADDDFRVASVSLLRLLFFPHSRAQLVPVVKVVPVGMTSNLKLFLWNRGTATASDVFLQINHGLLKDNSGESISLKFAEMVNHWLVIREVDSVRRIRGQGPIPIHPGESTHVGSITVGGEITPRTKLDFRIDVFCTDGEPWSWKVSLGLTELLHPLELKATSIRSLSFVDPTLL
jgi:hypothetical protein